MPFFIKSRKFDTADIKCFTVVRIISSILIHAADTNMRIFFSANTPHFFGVNNVSFVTHKYLKILHLINPIALRMAKTPQSFGHSECNRVN